jgi:hypothetical protein
MLVSMVALAGLARACAHAAADIRELMHGAAS